MDEGLRAECEQAADMGFDGKTLITRPKWRLPMPPSQPSEAGGRSGQASNRGVEAAEAEGQGRRGS